MHIGSYGPPTHLSVITSYIPYFFLSTMNQTAKQISFICFRSTKECTWWTIIQTLLMMVSWSHADTSSTYLLFNVVHPLKCKPHLSVRNIQNAAKQREQRDRSLSAGFTQALREWTHHKLAPMQTHVRQGQRGGGEHRRGGRETIDWEEDREVEKQREGR